MVQRTEIRLYRLIREHDDEPQTLEKKKKTYWDKYPELKVLKNVGKRRIVTFMFFAYMFLFSTAEYTGVMCFGYRCLIAQLVITIFSVISALCFEYSIREVKVAFMIPFMSIVMGGLSCYVCLFALVIFTFVNIPPYQYVILTFHVFLSLVTLLVTFSLARGTDLLWQGFFLIVDLSVNESLIEKLRTNARVDEGELDRAQQNASRFILAGRTFL